MLMRKKGCIKNRFLTVEGRRKSCPYVPSESGSTNEAACGQWCALFDTIVHDTTGKIIGAYLGCIDKQWTFKNGEEEV